MSVKYVTIQHVVKRILSNIIQPLNIQSYVMVVMIACKLQKIPIKYVSNIHVYAVTHINTIVDIIDIKKIAATNLRLRPPLIRKFNPSHYQLTKICKQVLSLSLLNKTTNSSNY